MSYYISVDPVEADKIMVEVLKDQLNVLQNTPLGNIFGAESDAVIVPKLIEAYKLILNYNSVSGKEPFPELFKIGELN